MLDQIDWFWHSHLSLPLRINKKWTVGSRYTPIRLFCNEPVADARRVALRPIGDKMVFKLVLRIINERGFTTALTKIKQSTKSGCFSDDVLVISERLVWRYRLVSRLRINNNSRQSSLRSVLWAWRADHPKSSSVFLALLSSSSSAIAIINCQFARCESGRSKKYELLQWKPIVNYAYREKRERSARGQLVLQLVR